MEVVSECSPVLHRFHDFGRFAEMPLNRLARQKIMEQQIQPMSRAAKSNDVGVGLRHKLPGFLHICGVVGDETGDPFWPDGVHVVQDILRDEFTRKKRFLHFSNITFTNQSSKIKYLITYLCAFPWGQRNRGTWAWDRRQCS